jgi:tetratricopeptide (TPR) repeat protein
MPRLIAKRPQDEFKRFVKLGDEARDGRDWALAAQHYKAALFLEPEAAGIHVQLGHCLKEARDFDGAEAAYLRALRITPDDVDLQLQLGHFYKLRGDTLKTLRHYRDAQARGSRDPHMLSYLATPGLAASLEAAMSAEPSDADKVRAPEEGGFPVFDFQFISLSRLHKEDNALVFSTRVELDRISRNEFSYLAQRRSLRFGCQVYAETSDSVVIASERGAVAEDKTSATSLIVTFSLPIALFVDRPWRLISLNCVYDGKFWFSDRGRPATYATVGLSNPEKQDLFKYYLENFNNASPA